MFDYFVLYQKYYLCSLPTQHFIFVVCWIYCKTCYVVGLQSKTIYIQNQLLTRFAVTRYMTRALQFCRNLKLVFNLKKTLGEDDAASSNKINATHTDKHTLSLSLHTFIRIRSVTRMPFTGRKIFPIYRKQVIKKLSHDTAIVHKLDDGRWRQCLTRWILEERMVTLPLNKPHE